MTIDGDDRRQERTEAFREFSTTRDPRLRDRLIESHLGLARHLANRFSGRGESVEDLTQVASMALIGAVDRFDPDRGVEFSTFATRTILGELKRHFRDKGWFVRAPRRIQELYLQVGETTGTLAQSLGRSPTIREIATAIGTSEDEVLEALEAGQGYRSESLDAPGPDGVALGEHFGGEDAALPGADERFMLAPLLKSLTPRERLIVHLRFTEGLTQSEIATQIGISQMHVSRLLAKSLDTLRSGLHDQ
jgi:RNA polymerase sigma-B factor